MLSRRLRPHKMEAFGDLKAAFRLIDREAALSYGKKHGQGKEGFAFKWKPPRVA